MNNETLELLSKKLEVPIQILWGALVKQAAIYSITNIILFLVTICFISIAIIVWRKVCNYYKGINKYEFGTDLIVSILFGFLVLLIFSCGFDYQMIAAGLMNPEYWALKQIIK